MPEYSYCPRGCGKKWLKNDQMAALAHAVVCKKQIWNGGKIGIKTK